MFREKDNTLSCSKVWRVVYFIHFLVAVTVWRARWAFNNG